MVQPRPAYWKALVLTGPLAAAFGYVVHALYHRIPIPILVVMAALGALLAAQTIHMRVVDDWRTEREIGRTKRLP
ncbi:MAG: hypothetical protein JO092_06145 [Candidatus Eremiobacteraeota bacterium]|nr:hypothetical protein [Candidatus Eremiobacteraeota bacterium]